MKRNIWNYAFGIAAVILYCWIFVQARLYSDALLQVFYVVVQLYGWRNWAQSKDSFGEVVVLRLTRADQRRWGADIVVASMAWGWVMHRFTDAAAPWLDASVAMTAVAAQILLTRHTIETWYLWVAVNALSIFLYASRGLYITMVLFCAMLVLAVWSLLAWQQAEQRWQEQRSA